MQHRGRQVFLHGNILVPHWLCWCEARWLSPPMTHAFLWCPLGPVNVGTSPPAKVLSMTVTAPKMASRTEMPFVVSARVGRVGTPFASLATMERALLAAHAIQLTFEQQAEPFRWDWRPGGSRSVG